MAKRRRGDSRPVDHRAANRTARVGELIRRILAEELEEIEDPDLELMSITSVDVDRDLNRAIVWFTTLDPDGEDAAAASLAELRGRLRRAVGDQARLRKTPDLEFRPDGVVRSAERIESLLRDDGDTD